MDLIKKEGSLKVTAQKYTLTFAADRPFVYLNGPDKEWLAELFIYSSVHPLNGRDDTPRLRAMEAEQRGAETVVSLTADSSVWKSKTYRFRCQENRFVYEVEVEGHGQLCEVYYFGGYYSGHTRWGAGFFWSGQRFRQGFNPEPNQDEENLFSPAEGAMIDMMGVPLPGKGHWFFTPPPFCFGFETASGWLGLGVEARPGQNLFTEYGYHGRKGGFYLSLSYEGHTSVNGAYCLPAVSFDFGDDEYEVLESHVKAMQQNGLVELPVSRAVPDWWRQPIFCGWGEQCYLAARDKNPAPFQSRQPVYEQALQTLDENGIDPGIVVLDDKWQATYGENEADLQKWPDLPGFVSRQHRRGRKVLLWLKAWDAEGLPVEECIVNAGKLPLSVDPTNPAYERRLRASIRNMLSPQGYDADGFKIDFTARIPSGPGICVAGDLWGLELLHCYLDIIYSEAKRVKPDALIIAHTPHPYLSGLLDIIRLNDVNIGADICKAMTMRARVASIACPDAIIDTDNWPMPDKAAWREYVSLQPDLGVPSLYFASHIDNTQEALGPDDYQLIRECWAGYRAKMPLQQKELKSS